jgi:hypothetical protein
VTGDFTSVPLRGSDQWTGARLQQGRVLLDGDWNLNLDAAERERQHLALDAIGPAGVPQGSTGFKISFTDGALQIGEGGMWVGGLYAVNPAALAYSAQEGIGSLPEAGSALVYLDAFVQEVQAAEDPGDLLDPALDGVDTTTRTRIGWRVGVATVNAASCADAASALPVDLISSGGLDVTYTLPASTDDLCAPPDDPRGKLPDGLLRVEVLDTGTEATARFAWSYENGAAAVAVTKAGPPVQLAPSPSTTFFPNDLVEVSTLQRRADRAAHGSLLTVEHVDSSAAGQVVTLNPSSTVTGTPLGLCLRRWDGQTVHADSPVTATLAGTDVGVTFKAQPGTYLAGDWWAVKVRGSADQVEELSDAPPDGTRHFVAPLALVDLTAMAVLTDCRPQFPSLTAIKNSTCSVDVGPSDVDDGASLQAFLTSFANQGSMTIRLNPGTYTLPEPLVLGPEFDGITLQACREGVVLQGPSEPDPAFVAGLIAIQGANSVTIQGIDLSIPLAGFSVPDGSFSGLSPANQQLLDNHTGFSAGLQVAIGISVNDSASLTVENCTFDLPDPGGANLFGAGIYATGQMEDIVITGCTFQSASQPATVPFYDLARGTQPPPQPPYELTFGYLQVPIAPSTASQLLHDAALERCVFLGMTVPTLLLTSLGSLHIGQNKLRNCYSGFWLVSIDPATQAASFDVFAHGDPTVYLQAAEQGITPLVDRIFVIAIALGQILPTNPPASDTGMSVSIRLDFGDCQVDALLADSYSGAGLFVADLAQITGSAVVHDSRIHNRFKAGPTALLWGLAETCVTGNVLANEVVPPTEPTFTNPNSFSIGVVFPPLRPLGAPAVAITGNVFIDPTNLPGRPNTIPSALADWDVLNTVIPFAVPPTVTGISPTTGTAAGGTAVTINGSGFTGVTGVTFASASAAFTIVSDTQITATSPRGSGAVTVTVTTPAGQATTQFTYTGAAPTITGISPTSGPTAGGTAVTINGSGFTGTTGVTFAKANAAFTIVSDTQITATSPQGSGTVTITVTNPVGPATAQFTYTATPPVITGIVPSSGPMAGGTAVTINGSGFTGTTGVTFAQSSTAFTIVSDSQITTTSPQGSGTVTITVTTPVNHATGQFTYTGPTPVLTGISPTQGTADGGTPVTITGSHLSGATDVVFGGDGADFTVRSDTQITATTPGSSTGQGMRVAVTVTTPAGTGGGVSFTYRKLGKETDIPALAPQSGPSTTSGGAPHVGQPGASQEAFIRPSERPDVGSHLRRRRSGRPTQPE